jgi:hypothetical protein
LETIAGGCCGSATRDRRHHGGLNGSPSVCVPSELAAEADIGGVLGAATVAIAADDAWESMKKGRASLPAPNPLSSGS